MAPSGRKPGEDLKLDLDSVKNDDSMALYGALLEPDERKFVDHLVRDPDGNLAAAARAAGLDCSDLSEAGGRMLKRSNVAKAIAYVHADRRWRFKDIRDGAVQALWALCTHDIKDLARAGELLPPDELPDSIRCAVKGVKLGRYGFEYTLVDRSVVLLALLKHFGDLDKKGEQEKETEEGVTVVFETS